MGLTPISNGNQTTLGQNPGTLPQMGDALYDYFQAMTFEILTKVVTNYQVVETTTPVSFQGVWQPFTKQALDMKPRGQRQWKWFRVHADPSLVLNPDDVILYQSIQYRVMSVLDYTSYGYREYELIDDYTGSGPTVTTP